MDALSSVPIPPSCKANARKRGLKAISGDTSRWARKLNMDLANPGQSPAFISHDASCTTAGRKLTKEGAAWIIMGMLAEDAKV